MNLWRTSAHFYGAAVDSLECSLPRGFDCDSLELSLCEKADQPICVKSRTPRASSWSRALVFVGLELKKDRLRLSQPQT